MRSATEIDGVLLVDKAPGMTSHDVVAIARRTLGTKKVGHCGTLDPLATGLLLITIGRGTKIQDLLMSEDKEYVGTIRLGEVTDSQDADGQIIETNPVPNFTREEIERAFAQIQRRFLPDAADDQRDQEEWSASLQAGTPGQTDRTRSALCPRLRSGNQGDSPAGCRLSGRVQQGILCENLRQ